MSKAQRKLERLLNLTAALLETVRPLTAREVFERVPGYPPDPSSAQRAFQRDKDDLREMGVPIAMIELTGEDPPVVGYRIPKRDYELRDPGLEPDELAALHLAMATVSFDEDEAQEGLAKLGGRPGEVALPAGPPELSVTADPRLGPLFGAVSERRAVRFGYGGERRELEPHRLEYGRGRWYVTGRDRTKDAPRNFRLDKIEDSIEVLDDPPFPPVEDPPSSVRVQPWEMGDGDTVRALLLVDAPRARWAMHHLGAARIREERDDGSVVFEVAVRSRAAFRSFVLGFLEHAEILEPEELRSDLVTWLGAAR